MNRKPIFDAVRRIVGRPFIQAEVDALDAAIEAAEGSLPASQAPQTGQSIQPPSAGQWRLGLAGSKLIKTWEGCAKRRADGSFAAYPDPGSADGQPWTIGWGSTGQDIGHGLSWTQQQCDDRFERDIVAYVDQVARAIGTAPTSQSQFDALVAFHYNTGAIATATLTELHKRGHHIEAQAQFGKWIYNDHRPLAGLKNRRAAEAALYTMG